jgi:regulatory protein
MKVIAIRYPPRSRDRAVVQFEDGGTLSIAREILMRSKVQVDEEIGEERLIELRREELAWRARESALRLLSVRARSSSELSQRLRRKDFPADVVDSCVAELVEKRLVDDAAFAESMVRDRVRSRPQGTRRLANELRARGIGPEGARAAIDRVMRGEGVDELELANQAARKWRHRPGEDPTKARRRLHDYLARRGFAPSTIRRVIEKLS